MAPMFLLLALPSAPSGARAALEPTHGGGVEVGEGLWGQDPGVASWLVSIRIKVMSCVLSACTSSPKNSYSSPAGWFSFHHPLLQTW